MKEITIQNNIKGFISALAILTAVLFFTYNMYAQTPDFAWAQRAGGTDHDYARAITSDAAGNNYIVGYFYGSATFGSITLTSVGPTSNIFIAKYDAAGNVVWAQSAGGWVQGCFGITNDGMAGIIITGYFNRYITFGSITLTSLDDSGVDLFIVKYNYSGNVQWAKMVGGNGSQEGHAITTDSGNIIITGYFSETASFAPNILISAGNYDIFIAKFDAAGNVLWAKSAGGSGDDYGYAIASDLSGNYTITGRFTGSATFGSITLTSAGGSADIFITQYDASGNVRWARRAGGSGFDGGYAIASDEGGNPIIAGNFSGSATFGSITLSSVGSDIFTAKYNTAGDVLWAKQAGSTAVVTSEYGIATDGSGNIFVAGSFVGSTNFDGIALTSAGGSDIFIAKYDASGNIQWATAAGGTGNESANYITTDGMNNCISTGYFSGTATFSSINLTSAGSEDVFIAKLVEAPDWTLGIDFILDQDSYKFKNTGTTRSWEMFKQFYGEEATYLTSFVRSPLAYRYYELSYQNITPGASCAGFASTSLINCFGLSQPNAGDFAMPHYDNLYGLESINTDPQVISTIAFYHGCQSSLLFSQTPKESDVPTIINKMKTMIQNDMHFVIGIVGWVNNKQGGHIVTPYRMDGFEDRVNVHIYDSNFPGEEKTITFYPDQNSWSYFINDSYHFEGLPADMNLYIYPVNYFLEQGIPSWWNDIDEIWASIKGKASSYFERISFEGRIGYANGTFVNEIPNAIPIVKYGGLEDSLFYSEYLLPTDYNYTVNISGFESDTLDFAVSESGLLLQIINAEITSSSNDQIEFSMNDASIGYSTNGTQKIFTANLIREFEDKSRLFTISNTSISNADSSKFQIVADQSLKYVNIGSPKTYDLTLVQVGIDSGVFEYANIAMGENEAHILTPTDWQALDTAHVVLEVDQGNDGSIDYTAILGQITQSIFIKSGKLNMISFNVEPSDLAISSMLDDLATLLVAQDDDGKFYIPPYGVNTIGNVDLSNGYQVYITGSADDNVVNDGDPLVLQDYSQALNNTKLFMIGYPYQNPHPVTEVFATIISAVVVVQDDAGRFWIPRYGVNTMGNMLPGKGYQIYADQTVNFTYPALAGGLAKASAPLAELPEPSHFQFTETGLPYGIVVTGSEQALTVGDEVGVFAGELCVGASVFTGDYPLVMAAWEGHEEYGLTGFKAGQTISLRVWKVSESKEMEVAGRFSTSDESSFRAKPISVVHLAAFISPVALPTTFALDQNYPNPFNPETVIEYQLPEDSKVSLRIYNLLGQEIRSLVDAPKKAGYHKVSWDGKDEFGKEVSSGVYLYTIKAGNFRMTKKMVKME